MKMALLWPYQTTKRALQQVAVLIILTCLCLERLQQKKTSGVTASLFFSFFFFPFFLFSFFCSDRLSLWYQVNWARHCPFWDNLLPQLHYQATVLTDRFLLFKVPSNKLYPLILILSLKGLRKLKRLTFFLKLNKSLLSIGKYCISIMENVKRQKLKLQIFL